MTRTRLLAGSTRLVLVLSSAGCATWAPYQVDVAAPAETLPSPLRATSKDSTRALVLSDPYLRADTLHGNVRGRPVALPLGQVARLERRHISPGGTVMLLGGLGAAAGSVYLIVCGNRNCEAEH
jgi:hypothetical protein